jgi:hypothetical protein
VLTRAASDDGVAQCRHRQGSLHPGGDGVGDDRAGADALQRAWVGLAFGRVVLRDVVESDDVVLGCSEVPVDEVIVHRWICLAVQVRPPTNADRIRCGARTAAGRRTHHLPRCPPRGVCQ